MPKRFKIVAPKYMNIIYPAAMKYGTHVNLITMATSPRPL